MLQAPLGVVPLIYGRARFQVMWPPSWSSVEISAKELVPVVLAAAVWGSTWSGHHVLFHVDNMAVVAVLKKKASKDSLLTHLIRCLNFYAAYHNLTGLSSPQRTYLGERMLLRMNYHCHIPLVSLFFTDQLVIQKCIVQRIETISWHVLIYWGIG